jgi:hypothetical protein
MAMARPALVRRRRGDQVSHSHRLGVRAKLRRFESSELETRSLEWFFGKLATKRGIAHQTKRISASSNN